MSEQVITVKFEGIDSMGRAVFKDTDSTARYGDLNKLFSDNAHEMEVLENVNFTRLKFFGNRFDCEPDGGFPTHIVRPVV